MKKVLLFAFAFISVCATAQIYPHVDGFETYTDLTELGTQGGYSSDMTVYSTHGINSSTAVVARMNNGNTEDTLVSPVIGPLTAVSVFSFQYRVMENNAYPGAATTLGAGDVIEVMGRTSQSAVYYPVTTIDAGNHVASANFKKVSFSLEAAAGMNVQFMVRVTRGVSGNYFVDMDSFSVKNETGGLIIKPTIANPVCNGGTDGTITLIIEGGVAPYTYGWSNTLASTPVQNNLAAGTYSVTVWDNSGRSATATWNLTQPEPVTVSAAGADALCSGSDNGAINATVHSGVAPFTFMWSNNAQTEDLSGLTAGIYHVVVSDASGCTGSVTQTVSEPIAISMTEMHTNLTAPGSNDGTITVLATGGSWNYEYSLDGFNYSASSVFSGLPAGCYTVRIKDSNNCRYTSAPVCIAQLVAGVSELNSTNVNIYPNPANTYVNVRTDMVNSGDVFIANSLGVMVMRKTIVSNETRMDVSGLPVGKYIVALRTEKGNYKKHLAIVR